MIKTCGEKDISAVMAFLRQEWSSSHIMANNNKYVDYFFHNKTRGHYNIVCSHSEQTNEIEGFIAFVPMSLFDSDIPPGNDFVWVTNWLVGKSAKSCTGIMLFMKMLDICKCEGVGVVGQNEAAERIYQKMKYRIGALSHYYVDKKRSELDDCREFKQLNYSQIEEIGRFHTCFPKKTARYIANKYLKSPFYKYYARGVLSDDGRLTGAIIFKIQNYPESFRKRCIRIVEFFGAPSCLTNKGNEFQSLLAEFKADYIDFYCAGIGEHVLLSSGFVKNEGHTVIPNYFEPFLNKNIELRYAYNLPCNTDKFLVFKGDGDRDFPRIV